MKKYKIVISGYSSFDYIVKLNNTPKKGETSIIKNSTCRKIYWGGCSVNVAVALSRLGFSTLPILRVGDDFETSGFKEFLQNEGVFLDAIKYVPGEVNPTSFLLQSPDGEHITAFYPGAMDNKHFIPYEDEWFMESETALMTVASLEDNMEFLRKVEKFKVPLFFGMKGDFSAFPKEFLKNVLKKSKVIFMNHTEKKQIEDLLQLKDITELFRDSNVEVIVTTLGSEGSRYYSSNGESEKIPAVKVNSIVDTTGSGDAFISGFLYGYFNDKNYKECCKLGSYLSSFVLEAEGCCTNLPDKKRLKERIDWRTFE